jgi:hypothetical protein
MKEKRPHFVPNTVLPNTNIGPILFIEHQGYLSAASWIKALWEGCKGNEDFEFTPLQYYINIQDNEHIHLAALIYSDVQGERLFLFAHPYTWNNILAVF